jgi:hypothetical protein
MRNPNFINQLQFDIDIDISWDPVNRNPTDRKLRGVLR